ncbi:MAG: hypothetical protein WBG70_11655 [Spirulinaceae cyanobacterium]
MLYNDEWNEELQAYATDLLKTLRLKKSSQWSSDWRHDVFLGTACDITLRYNERNQAYKRAYEASKEPPAELTWLLARCLFTPGKPPISENEAIRLLEEGLSQKQFIEGTQLLVSLYRNQGNTNAQAYWQKRLELLREKSIHAQSIEPLALHNS